MNDETMVISAFGFVDGASYGGSSLGGAIKPLPPEPFEKLRWDTFSERLYKRYWRLDILSRYSMVAVELLGMPVFETAQGDMALVMGTRQGCLAVDLDFRDSMEQEGGGSPLLFMYTLHNACMGEIAIRYNITGPNLCLMAGEESGLSAIWEGIRLIRCGEVTSCICLAADALGTWADSYTKAALSRNGSIQGAAYCLLIESASQAANKGIRPLAHIRGFEGKPSNALEALACKAQLDSLHHYLANSQPDSAQDSRMKLHLNLYHRSDVLYIDRC